MAAVVAAAAAVADLVATPAVVAAAAVVVVRREEDLRLCGPWATRRMAPPGAGHHFRPGSRGSAGGIGVDHFRYDFIML